MPNWIWWELHIQRIPDWNYSGMVTQFSNKVVSKNAFVFFSILLLSHFMTEKRQGEWCTLVTMKWISSHLQVRHGVLSPGFPDSILRILLVSPLFKDFEPKQFFGFDNETCFGHYFFEFLIKMIRMVQPMMVQFKS